MEVHTTRKDIGAGQAHKRQTRTIGTATNGLDYGLHIGHTHSLYGLVNHVGMWLYHLTHIEVLVLQSEFQNTLAILLLQQIDARPHKYLLLLELLAVVVTNDIRNLGILNRAVEAYAVVESLIACCVLGALNRGNKRIQIARNLNGVNHLVLGISGVYVTALNLDCCRRSIEVLILQLALGATIHCVSEVSTKCRHVEIIHATTNLLVGCEADANLAVCNLGVRNQILRSGHNLGTARLVVSTQKGSAIGVDKRVANKVLQLGEVRNLHCERAVKLDITAIILLNHARTHVLATHIGRCIYVGDKTDYGGILIALGCRYSTHSVAVLIHRYVLHTECAHLIGQIVKQNELLLGRGECCAVLVRLCVE